MIVSPLHTMSAAATVAAIRPDAKRAAAYNTTSILSAWDGSIPVLKLFPL